MNMHLALRDDNVLDITDLSSSASEEAGDDGGGVSCRGDYELLMAVGHVKEAWMEVPGNLVAHIRVGPSYHLRKEVSFNLQRTFNLNILDIIIMHENSTCHNLTGSLVRRLTITVQCSRSILEALKFKGFLQVPFL